MGLQNAYNCLFTLGNETLCIILLVTGCVIKNGHPNSTKVGAFIVMVLMFCDSIGSKRTE